MRRPGLGSAAEHSFLLGTVGAGLLGITIISMGDLQDPKMEVRKRTICLAIFSGDIH